MTAIPIKPDQSELTPKLWSTASVSMTAVSVALAAIALAVGVLGILASHGVALGPLNTLGSIIPQPVYGLLCGLGGSLLPCIGLLIVFKYISHSIHKKKPFTPPKLPTFETVLKVAPLISAIEYQKIQETIAAQGRVKKTRFIRKGDKTATYSLSITPKGVVFIHFGKKGQKVGDGSCKTVYEAVRLGEDSAIKVAEARIKKTESAQEAITEDNLARKFASTHIMGSSEAVIQYRVKKREKIRFMQPLMAKDGIAFAEESPTLVEMLSVFEQVAEGLKEMHAQGYMHRDVKPENIFFAANGNAKLADLGLAARSPKFHKSKPYATQGRKAQLIQKILPFTKIFFSNCSGTIGYVPPLEHDYYTGTVTWERQTCLTDLYALGNTIEEMMKNQTDTPQAIKDLRVQLKLLKPEERPTIDKTITIIQTAIRTAKAAA